MHICWQILFRSVWETLISGTLSVWRTMRMLFGWLGLFVLGEFCLMICLLLDHVLFPGFRRAQVKAPVFVIGNPRSGTTHLFRLLAMDRGRFTSLTLLEIIFPAITLRWCIAVLRRIDPYLGHFLRYHRKGIERDFLEPMDRFHKARFNEPEEDDYLTAHQFAMPLDYMTFNASPTFRSLAVFDYLPQGLRRKVSAFYRSCLKRHLYWCGQGRTLLSKNPSMCTKIQTVRERFPDARFIYILRNPTVAMASFGTMMAHGLSSTGERLPQRHGQWLFDTGCTFYRYAFEQLEQLPSESCCFVEYERLIRQPAETVFEIYQHFGWEPSPEFVEQMNEASAAAKNYRSRNHYKLDLGNITAQQIRDALPFIYDKYEFQETVDEETPAETSVPEGATAVAG